MKAGKEQALCIDKSDVRYRDGEDRNPGIILYTMKKKAKN